jgi:hypothetical protein
MIVNDGNREPPRPWLLPPDIAHTVFATSTTELRAERQIQELIYKHRQRLGLDSLSVTPFSWLAESLVQVELDYTSRGKPADVAGIFPRKWGKLEMTLDSDSEVDESQVRNRNTVTSGLLLMLSPVAISAIHP